MFNGKEFRLCRSASFRNLRVPMAVLFDLLLSACGGGGGGGAAPAPAPAPLTSVVLPETGQTTCYDAAFTAITCTGTSGQDGELRAGVAWPAPRFVVGTGAGTTDQCVTDSLTGLMWVRAPSATPDTWANALTSANGLSLCGFSDWRLPNRKELRSLIDYGSANNAATLNTQGFNTVQAVSYWSSSSFAYSTGNAWVVNLLGGNVNVSGKLGLSNYVWPVRAGQ